MEEVSIKELRKAIDKMTKMRDRAVLALGKDKAQLTAVESRINTAGQRHEQMAQRVEELAEKLQGYDDTIGESEQAYKKILENTNAIINTLDYEQQNYRNRFSTGNGASV